ncbi:MAG: Flp pilus assembly protein CpaB [Candidatus Limnocylindrales bacterium]
MKRSSNRLVLLVGIFLAVVAFVLIAIMLQGGGPGGSNGPSVAPTTVKIVVATKDLPLGATITEDAVALQDVEIGAKPGDSYTATALVVGKTVRSAVVKGAYITTEDLSGGGTVQDIKVPAGFVGIPVQVDQLTGVGTLIKPGDRVDVVVAFTGLDKVPLAVNNHGVIGAATPTPRTSGSPAPSRVVGANELYNPLNLPYNPTTVKTVVEGLQVLGTLLPPPTTAAQQPAASGQTTTETNLNGQQEIVILAATVQQAEAIRYAQLDGTIALVLRSAADCQTPDGTPTACPIIPTTGITLRKMVDDFGVLPPQVVEVLEPTPYPSPMPVRVYPSPTPSPTPLPSGSPVPSAS